MPDSLANFTTTYLKENYDNYGVISIDIDKKVVRVVKYAKILRPKEALCIPKTPRKSTRYFERNNLAYLLIRQ